MAAIFIGNRTAWRNYNLSLMFSLEDILLGGGGGVGVILFVDIEGIYNKYILH